MRILHCLRAPVGGLFRHVCDLAVAQASAGHDVGIMCDSIASDALTAPRLAAVTPHLALGVCRIAVGRAPGVSDISAVVQTRRFARAHHADILHGHGAKGGVFARAAAASLGHRSQTVRAFYTPHGGSLHYSPSSLSGRVYLGVERQLLRVTDGLIFESDFACRTFKERIGCGDVATRVIYNGLSLQEFETIDPAPDAADFLFIGELRHLKGVDVLLEAVARVRTRRPITSVIVGDGAERAQFEAQAAALGISSVVRFTGALPARAALALGRCLVVPSRAESLPYVILEAAAAGRPVIATDVGGIPEIVAGTQTKLMPAGDAAALENELLSHLETPARADSRAIELRQIVSGRFSVDRMTSDILDFYGTTASQERLVAPRTRWQRIRQTWHA